MKRPSFKEYITERGTATLLPCLSSNLTAEYAPTYNVSVGMLATVGWKDEWDPNPRIKNIEKGQDLT